jgi:hypothetical protein
MARALDRCHERGIAHCDLKPDNYCKLDHDFVLVDGDSVTELASQPSWLPFTVPYATADMLRNNHPEKTGNRPLLAEDIVAHDRFGFGLLVLGAVVGSAWMGEAARGTPGARTVDDLTDLQAALALKWPSNARWADLTTLLAEPFDEATVRREGWTCRKWLDRVVELAERPPTRPDPDKSRDDPPYDGPYAAAVASIRAEVTARRPHLPDALPVVDDAILAAENRVCRQTRARWAAGVGLTGLAVVAVLINEVVTAVGRLW